MQPESISLRFKQGSSDKVYNAELKAHPDGWLVNFAYGRYGKPLKHGTKTAKPLPYDQAKYAYDKLVNEKSAKGYTPDASGTPFTAPQIDQERTGFLPQLLNPIEPENLPEALSRASNELWLQIKYDGERRIVIAEPGDIYGSNRKGLRVPLPEPMTEAIQSLVKKLPVNRLVLDGEDMGNRIYVFDILKWGDQDLTSYSFAERTNFLLRTSILADDDIIRVALPRKCESLGEIESYMRLCEDYNQEGVVLRDPSAPYTAGRPNSWGPCLKIKFYASATCIVESVHPTKSSIGLKLIDARQGESVSVGNCTIPPNYKIPTEGQLVEIKYLYAYHGGSLYQPQYKGVRHDLELCAATLDQLKYKE